jgi:hypothetical protein
LGASFVRLARHWQLLSRQRDGSVLAVLFQRRRLLHYSGHLVRSFVNGRRSLVLRDVEGCDDFLLPFRCRRELFFVLERLIELIR